ncbi:MAG: hypothetical protein ACODAD_06845 [Planctomycetota bacterium]
MSFPDKGVLERKIGSRVPAGSISVEVAGKRESNIMLHAAAARGAEEFVK